LREKAADTASFVSLFDAIWHHWALKG